MSLCCLILLLSRVPKWMGCEARCRPAYPHLRHGVHPQPLAVAPVQLFETSSCTKCTLISL